MRKIHFHVLQILHDNIYFQEAPTIFNKAALMNIGFLEASQQFVMDCVIFHDVDMIPQDDRNFYTCVNSPRHMTPYVNKFKYK